MPPYAADNYMNWSGIDNGSNSLPHTIDVQSLAPNRNYNFWVHSKNLMVVSNQCLKIFSKNIRFKFIHQMANNGIKVMLFKSKPMIILPLLR